MTTASNVSKGALGEQIAAAFLTKKGFKIIEKNFKAGPEEIDLIAVFDEILVFVEVKTRWDKSHGLPEEAVTPRKLRLLTKAAEYFAITHPGLPASLQIDVVAVEIGANNQPSSITHFPNVTS